MLFSWRVFVVDLTNASGSSNGYARVKASIRRGLRAAVHHMGEKAQLAPETVEGVSKMCLRLRSRSRHSAISPRARAAFTGSW